MPGGPIAIVNGDRRSILGSIGWCVAVGAAPVAGTPQQPVTSRPRLGPHRRQILRRLPLRRRQWRRLRRRLRLRAQPTPAPAGHAACSWTPTGQAGHRGRDGAAEPARGSRGRHPVPSPLPGQSPRAGRSRRPEPLPGQSPAARPKPGSQRSRSRGGPDGKPIPRPSLEEPDPWARPHFVKGDLNSFTVRPADPPQLHRGGRRRSAPCPRNANTVINAFYLTVEPQIDDHQPALTTGSCRWARPCSSSWSTPAAPSRSASARPSSCARWARARAEIDAGHRHLHRPTEGPDHREHGQAAPGRLGRGLRLRQDHPPRRWWAARSSRST